MRKQGVVLRHITYLPFLRPYKCSAGCFEPKLLPEMNAAFLWLIQPGQASQHGGFARARGAKQHGGGRRAAGLQVPHSNLRSTREAPGKGGLNVLAHFLWRSSRYSLVSTARNARQAETPASTQ